MLLALGSMITIMLAPALHNVYHLVSVENYANFIVLNKLLSCAASAYLVIKFDAWLEYMTYNPNVETEERTEKSDAQNNNYNNDMEANFRTLIGDDRTISLAKALIKVSFSMYLFSFFYIRLDYMTTRILFPISLYVSVSREVFNEVN